MIQGNEAVDISNSFLLLSGYFDIDILNKNIEEIFRSLLRLDIDISDLNSNPKSYFIFTKNIELIEVSITIKPINNKKLITFIEKPYPRLGETFLYRISA